MVKTRVSISPVLGSVPCCDRQTDRQTDGQTDRIAIANTRSQQYLPVQLSRVKNDDDVDDDVDSDLHWSAADWRCFHW